MINQSVINEYIHVPADCRLNVSNQLCPQYIPLDYFPKIKQYPQL